MIQSPDGVITSPPTPGSKILNRLLASRSSTTLFFQVSRACYLYPPNKPMQFTKERRGGGELTQGDPRSPEIESTISCYHGHGRTPKLTCFTNFKHGSPQNRRPTSVVAPKPPPHKQKANLSCKMREGGLR
jgi:hypothetical protein